MVFGFGSSRSSSKIEEETSEKKVNGKPGYRTTPGAVALVTGSSGFCGARLAEILLERGAKTVVCFDIVKPKDELMKRMNACQAANPGGKFVFCNGPTDGDLTSMEAVEKAFSSVNQLDIVFHVAALVGPFHEKDMYYKVNVEGTKNILDACRKYNVPTLVNSSSPSTRFDGGDIEGRREDELYFPKKYTALYAETKAEAERLVTSACSKTLRTINVAPHQVYGPHDELFLPALLSTMGNGRLRIFGKGDKMISVCFVDNYCHGLLCGADEIALNEESPALGKLYIITDCEPKNFWNIINEAGMEMGFKDLHSKFHLPTWLLYFVAYICGIYTFLSGRKTKLTPFTVRMMTIHRYFDPTLSREHLKYEPIYAFNDSWKLTVAWFKENWLPGYYAALKQPLPSMSNDASENSEKED
mmetsp:Transcript_32952/g.49757  ORF Transcript_32952/g.49757 Transcript_32952/m.49757 type:complete len:415 (+) Transcript_32952:143-1387(+)|eukprot:CAMPEP_0178927984 /NCGR_PEP_ID=MMETSP0786-20121207/19569_1 /TAXON_ID=186022 /ORGANISM="Thalassionema frauenfeldii, Strain CCMP 1798" /LENGTH=414 /DNA_ID=CAMNT_0020603633 /DNA_START=62 /DNA_END=1306 /DNA_ORIENTATION=-